MENNIQTKENQPSRFVEIIQFVLLATCVVALVCLIIAAGYDQATRYFELTYHGNSEDNTIDSYRAFSEPSRSDNIIHAGAGNDTITTWGRGDRITVYGGEGDDKIYWQPPYYKETDKPLFVIGGPGEDTLYLDESSRTFKPIPSKLEGYKAMTDCFHLIHYKEIEHVIKVNSSPDDFTNPTCPR